MVSCKKGKRFNLIERLRVKMLNNFRESLKPMLQKVGRAFASTGLPANFWTAVSLGFAFASAIIYGIHLQHSFLIGGILLLVSGFFDIVDGQVARVTGKTSKKGAFLDSVFDKIAEVAIFLGILIGGYSDGYLVLLAITLSLLVSYTRARAESLGVQLQGIGIGERAERLLVIAIIGMIGFLNYAVIIVAIIAGITFVQRIVATARKIND
jgi:archaetidylinositol phosphate synthase